MDQSQAYRGHWKITPRTKIEPGQTYNNIIGEVIELFIGDLLLRVL